jgi:tetratricopeptide (TPR) repeat protein
MRAQRKDAQLDFGVRGQLAQGPVEMAVVGARGGDDADAALDADSLYFEGACYQEMRQFDKAIDVFKKTLEINPLHASAEFGLARALQRTGHTAEAREHFARFQHLTSTKISSALGLSYGEQGHYSTVTAVEEPETIARTHDSGAACGATDDGAGPRQFRIMDDDRRGMHDGRDGIRANGLGADASGRAGDSSAAQSRRRTALRSLMRRRWD